MATEVAANKTVIKYQNGELKKIKHEYVALDPQQQLVWDVALDAGFRLELRFRDHAGGGYPGDKGPFPRDPNREDVNPKRGLYVVDATGGAVSRTITTQPAEDKYGYWKYDVVVLEGGQEVDRKDPGVLIKDP